MQHVIVYCKYYVNLKIEILNIDEYNCNIIRLDIKQYRTIKNICVQFKAIEENCRHCSRESDLRKHRTKWEIIVHRAERRHR